MTIIGHQILYIALAHQALNHGDINPAIGFTLAAPDLSDIARFQTKENSQLDNPLIEQWLSMNQYQGIRLSLGNQPGADHCLACAGGCDKDTGILFGQSVHGLLLDTRKFSVELHQQGFTGMALILDDQSTAEMSEQVFEFIPATAWQGDMPGRLLGATDHPWCQGRR